MKYNILIADDHELMRDGLRPFLERGLTYPAKVLEAKTLGEAVATVAHSSIDLVLLDRMMPNGDLPPGTDAEAAIKKMLAQVPCIVFLTACLTVDTLFMAKRLGMRGVIPKIFSSANMMKAINAILNGGECWPRQEDL